jgi:drug/metabolite transporter (DMT)-like permease
VTRRGWWLFAALCLIWGIPYLLIKVAVRELTPASLVFLRTALGALLLLPLVLRRSGHLRGLASHWRPILAFTVCELAVPWFLLTDAERRLSSSLTGLLIASVPLVGAALARATGRGEPFDLRRAAGLVVGMTGVAALVGLDVGGGDAGTIAEMAVVVVGYAAGPLIISRWLADLPALEVITASLAVCAVAYAPAGLAQLPRSLPAIEVVGAVAGLGVFCTAIAFLVFFRLVAEVGPVRATVVTYVNPAVAVAAGVAILGEPLTPAIVAGFALVLLGSFLATRRPARAPGPPSAARPAA